MTSMSFSLLKRVQPHQFSFYLTRKNPQKNMAKNCLSVFSDRHCSLVQVFLEWTISLIFKCAHTVQINALWIIKARKFIQFF